MGKYILLFRFKNKMRLTKSGDNRVLRDVIPCIRKKTFAGYWGCWNWKIFASQSTDYNKYEDHWRSTSKRLRYATCSKYCAKWSPYMLQSVICSKYYSPGLLFFQVGRCTLPPLRKWILPWNAARSFGVYLRKYAPDHKAKACAIVHQA